MIEKGAAIDTFFRLLPYFILFMAIERRKIRSTTLLFMNKLLIQILFACSVKMVHFGLLLFMNGEIFSPKGYFFRMQENLFPSLKVMIYLINIVHSRSLVMTLFSIFGIYTRVYFNHITVPNLLLITSAMGFMEIVGQKKIYLRDEDRYSYKCRLGKPRDAHKYKFFNIERERFM